MEKNTRINEILAAREMRRETIKNASHIADSVSVKANIPGDDKCIPEANLVALYFTSTIKKYGVYDTRVYTCADGVWSLSLTEKGEELKNQAVRIESSHPLGRLVDVDVTLRGFDKSLSRGSMRRCFLCDEPALICGRIRRHRVEELVHYFRERTFDFFTAELSRLVFDSALEELSLENKFGLVSKNSNGSHKDLTFESMSRAAGEISIPITECFFVGLNSNSTENILEKIRPIGLLCEEKMLSATGGSNAYRGLIFIVGVLLAAVGYTIAHLLSYEDIYSIAAEISRDMGERRESTFGSRAYFERGFGGIRGEALCGFPAVSRAAQLLSDGEGLLSVLAKTVGTTDDSVLLKRAGNIEKYNFFRGLISGCNVNDAEELRKINELCVRENISIGGSADVLCAAILMNKIKELLF